MKKTNNVVQDWLNTIRIAIDPGSPFKGMVDLKEIFSLPLSTQYEIHNALTPVEISQLTALYGPK